MVWHGLPNVIEAPLPGLELLLAQVHYFRNQAGKLPSTVIEQAMEIHKGFGSAFEIKRNLIRHKTAD